MPKVHQLSLPDDEIISAATLLGQMRNALHPDLRFAEGVQCVIKECRADIQDEWRSSKPLTDLTREALLSMAKDLPGICILSSEDEKQRFVNLCIAHPNFPANTKPIIATVSDMAQNARDRDRATIEYERVLSEAVQRGELQAFKLEEGNPFHPAGKMDKVDLMTYLYRHEVVAYLPSIGFAVQPSDIPVWEAENTLASLNKANSLASISARWTKSELQQVPIAKRGILFKELLKVLQSCKSQWDAEEIKRVLFQHVKDGASSKRLYVAGANIYARKNEYSEVDVTPVTSKSINAKLDSIDVAVKKIRLAHQKG